jgi:hypothetical protein
MRERPAHSNSRSDANPRPRETERGSQPSADERKPSPSAAPQPTAVFLASSLGVAVALLTFFVDRPWWNAAALHFARTPQFLTYVVVVAAQIASAAVVTVVVVPAVHALWAQDPRGRGRVLAPYALLAALALIVVTASHIREPSRPFPHSEAKEDVLTAPVVAVALVAAMGMRLVQAAAERTCAETTLPNEGQIVRFVELRKCLQLLLTCLGVILGGAIFAAGANRNATLADNPHVVFPAEWVLLYGATVSGVVALAYWPTHARVVALGEELRDRCVPVPSPAAAAWAAWSTDRKALEELLGLQASTATSLRTGAAILTPLAGSGIGVLLGTN